MFAIFKREFKSYFSSPIGYVVLAVLLFLFGFFLLGVLVLLDKTASKLCHYFFLLKSENFFFSAG